MRSFVGLFIFVVLFLCAGTVLAHNGSYHRLQGVRLCLDERSVQVSVDVDKAHNTAYEREILEHLRQSLHSTLINFQVPFLEKANCTNKDGFVFSAFYTARETTREGQPAFIVAETTQVGDPSALNTLDPQESSDPFSKLKHEEEPLAVDIVLEDSKFDTVTSKMIVESELAGPLEHIFPKVNEDAFKYLALAWWDDNPRGLQPFSLLPYVIGSALTLAIAGLGWHLRFRQPRAS